MNQNVTEQPQAISPEYTWDLTEYYTDDQAFQAAVEHLGTIEIPNWRDSVQAIDGPDALLAALQSFDAIYDNLDRTYNYAQSKADLDATDATATAQVNSVVNLNIELGVAQSTLENKALALGSDFWNDAILAEGFAPYRYKLAKLREDAAHVLSDDKEELLVPSYRAESDIMSTFDKLSYSSMEFPEVDGPNGKKVVANYTNYLVALTDTDRAYRKRFLEAYAGAYDSFRDTFASNLGAAVNLAEQLAKIHGYTSLLDQKTHEARTSIAIYDALLEGARENVGVVAREAELRKAALGVETLYSFDSRVPIGHATAPHFDYPQTCELVKSALGVLGEDYVDTLDQAFSNRWIDVFPAAHKDTGANAGRAVGIHPWVLTNFTGDYNSVSTLAHELGHAVHQYRSYAAQTSAFNRDPTSVTSEVASTANELLLSRYMIAHAGDEHERLYYVQQELGLLNATFFGQMLFADFEKRAHAVAEGGGALTADVLDDIYAQSYRTFRPGFTALETDDSHWASVPHFYYGYYVYVYSMDVSVACNVVERLEARDAKTLACYDRFLAAGDSADTAELFRGIGVDVTDPAYIRPLMRRYSELLDLEEELLGL